MKARSGHIILNKKTQYKDMSSFFEDFYKTFLRESNQISEDPEYTNMLLQTNMMDISKNRKPEGYNRSGSMRMIFPIKEKGVEFYIYRPVYRLGKNTEVVRVTESLSGYLRNKGVTHDVEWDKLKERRSR